MKKWNRPRWAWAACAVASVGLLAACGGGGGLGSLGRSVTLNSATISSSSVGAGGNFSVSFSASSNAEAYVLESFVIPAGGSTANPPDNARFQGRTCSAVFACGNTYTESCSLSSSRVLSCVERAGDSALHRVAVAPGQYTVLSRACIFNEQLNYVCQSREFPLTVR